MSEESEQHWHLDRRVPIALIVTIAIQTGAAVWWAAGVNARVDQLERHETARSMVAPVAADRLTRVEVKVDTALDGIQEIKRLIGRIPPQQ